MLVKIMHHQKILIFFPDSSSYFVSFSSRAFRFSVFAETTPQISKPYLEPCQKSIMELFKKHKLLTSLALSC